MDESQTVPTAGIWAKLSIWFSTVLHPNKIRPRSKGIIAALSSAVFLGMMPIFGKQAIDMGVNPMAVVAIRTIFATILLMLAVVLLYRPYLYIYPAGMLGCLLAGWINGIGSLFYYSALARIDASVGHMLYSLYPLFLAIWLFLDRQIPNRITLLRIILAIPAIYLLTQAETGKVDTIGVLEMLVASALYALHIPINQRVLSDMPAPTVTLYTLIAMSSVVLPAYFVSRAGDLPENTQVWWPLLGLTLMTFFSRLALFSGVKRIGAMQTALLGLSELFVAVIFSYLWLGEQLSVLQWIGALLLITSLLLIKADKSHPWERHASVWFGWVKPPTLNKEYPWHSNK